MTRESILKNQGLISRKQPHHVMKHRQWGLAALCSILFCINCVADDSLSDLSDSHATRSVTGDVIRIPLGQQPGSGNIEGLPRMGVSRQAVLQQLGEPQQRRAAVGNPPISSWDYADVVVYFEYDHVIHIVSKHLPQARRP